MVKQFRKKQNPRINQDREVGVIIDCDEIAILVFPPPREHGSPHCHVISKKSRKVKGYKNEIFPEVKVYLDGTKVIIITEGFSKKDIESIGDIIFNSPPEGMEFNDKYLLKVWEALHGKFEKK